MDLAEVHPPAGPGNDSTHPSVARDRNRPVMAFPPALHTEGKLAALE
jgi:hypothetical protein